MRILYVDESGGFEAPNSHRSATPLMVIAGVALDHRSLPVITNEFLRLKARFFPRKVKGTRILDYVLAEVKGSDLRAGIRASSRDKRRHTIGFLDEVMKILTRNDGKVFGRVWVKDGAALDPRSSYTFAIQDLSQHFNHLLVAENDLGLVLCDGRLHHQDAQVSHSVFTKKNKMTGDAYPNIIEASVFGQSQNHVGLQLADLVASGFLFPMATRTYCVGHSTGPHMSPRFDDLRRRYGSQVKALQYRYQDEAARWRGGVVVSDALGRKPSKAMFETP